ncbi:hypothetical protein ACJVC5_11950 [Peredibacter sp. HCB2-198]|uniref:hypothetical protein n=1 Tax=Peredibacter sp. HCB2-198 TaxID=3383025 RepID=UPI0038B62B8D
MFKFFLILLLSTQAFSATQILPDLGSVDCQSSEVKKNSFWFELTSKHIDELIRASDVSGLDEDILKNQLVTLSYLEIFKTSQNSSSISMGYIYANASHHLGRLVRYHYWEAHPHEALGHIDRSLISGDLLGTAVRTFPVTLSRRLMSHSLDLYKTLSWSLVARSHCGKNHVTDLMENGGPVTFLGLSSAKYDQVFRLLKSAHLESDPVLFMKKFVAYEQTYLQHTMYSMPDIRLPTSIGMLDKMRFIPFNGEKQKSFYEWCGERDCDTTSLDLKNRVHFDQDSIAPEFSLISEDRLKNARIEEVINFILNGYCEENKLPMNLCP